MIISALTNFNSDDLPTAVVASAPWWGAPAGVIAGAVITLLAGMYTTRRRRIDDLATAALAREHSLTDERRAAAVGFLGAAHRFRSVVPNLDEMRPVLHELQEKLALVQISCSSALSGQASTVTIRAQLLLVSTVRQDWDELQKQVVELLSSEEQFVDGARELAGYPPVDQEAKRAARAEVEAWMDREFGEPQEQGS